MTTSVSHSEEKMTKRTLENSEEMEQNIFKQQKRWHPPNSKLEEYEQILVTSFRKLKHVCSAEQYLNLSIDWDLFTTITHSSNLPRDLLQNKVRQQVMKLSNDRCEIQTLDPAVKVVQLFLNRYEEEVMMQRSRTYFANLFAIDSSKIETVAKDDEGRCLGCKVSFENDEGTHVFSCKSHVFGTERTESC